MRLLIATARRGIVGGIETYLRSVIPALAVRGHQVALLYEHPAGEGQPTIDEHCPGLPAWQFTDSKESLAQAQRWVPDLCYAHDLEDPEHELAVLDLYPTVLFAHGYIGTCISGTKRFSFPTETPCSRPFGKSCLALYYPRRCGGLNPLTMLGLYSQQRRRNQLLHHYRAIMVASRHMHEEFRRHGVAPERLHLLPLFPTNHLPEAEPPQPREMTGRILMVGRFTNLKGGMLLVRAVAEARRLLERPVTLVLAGAGPDLLEMMALARREGVPVDCRGWVGVKERANLFRCADLLAVPSTWPEPFGLVGIEAACVGLPSVGFTVGGIRDWLLPGQTGEEADSDSPTPLSLADAITRALRDPEHHQRLRIGAWNTAHRFNLDSHLERLEELLEAVAQNRAAAFAIRDSMN
jgi:glycosyltransferase involved in cell wall biosynthesis